MTLDEAVLSSPKTAGPTVDAENPWPGLLAFREGDQGYFQGRRVETEELLRLVVRERLTVLFSLSGLGKSSLLQAGLFPHVRRENIFPVYIRLDFTPPKLNQGSVTKTDQTAQVIAAVAQQASAHQIEAPTPNPDETLWEYFHREGNIFWNARNRPVMPLLVFDQFEEVFTLGPLDPERSEATETFIDQLADLAECRIPARLKEQVDDHPHEASSFNFGRHYYKVLLSLREDFLADLDALRVRMPSVALNRMRLRRMNGEAALLVVSQAKNLIDRDVAEQVVRFVAADKRHLPLTDLELEPALLSVVSRELNNRRRQWNEPKITGSLLQGNQEQVLADFYERSTADLSPEVRLFIEDHMLTVSGFRDTVALDNALSFPGVTRDAIDVLVERRLVRREDRGGSQRLELTHDLLAGVVRGSRDNRHQREAAERERAELLASQEEQKQALLKANEEERRQLEAAQERERRERDRRDLRRFRIATVVFAVLTLAALVAAGWAIWAQRRARKQEAVARYQEALAETAQSLARRQAKLAQQQEEKEVASVQLLSSLGNKNVQAAVNSDPTAAAVLPRVYLQIVNESDRDYARDIKVRLTSAGILVLGIEYVPAAGGLNTDVRFYRKPDEPQARKIAELLKGAGIASVKTTYLQGYENSTKVRPNHFEVWLANGIRAVHGGS